MEVKPWSYEELPEYTEEIEGVVRLSTTGDEVGIHYINNVEYACIGDTKLYLQILIPYTRNDQTSLMPCIVYVQGSAWFEQNVYESVPDIAKLAAKGYVVAVVQYRHSGIASFPAQIYDARNAVRFMKVHAEEYRVDVRNIFMSGNSSGGHTAMFAGMFRDQEQSLFPEVSADVNGIINCYGSTSFMKEDSNPTTQNHCKADSPEGLLLGGIDFSDNQELKQKLSVECNIFEDTVIPPTLIFHGTKDRIVNCECSVLLYRRMKECKKDVQLYLLEGADHGGPEFWRPEVLDIWVNFLKKHTV